MWESNRKKEVERRWEQNKNCVYGLRETIKEIYKAITLEISSSHEVSSYVFRWNIFYIDFDLRSIYLPALLSFGYIFNAMQRERDAVNDSSAYKENLNLFAVSPCPFPSTFLPSSAGI